MYIGLHWNFYNVLVSYRLSLKIKSCMKARINSNLYGKGCIPPQNLWNHAETLVILPNWKSWISWCGGKTVGLLVHSPQLIWQCTFFFVSRLNSLIPTRHPLDNIVVFGILNRITSFLEFSLNWMESKIVRSAEADNTEISIRKLIINSLVLMFVRHK